MYFALH